MPGTGTTNVSADERQAVEQVVLDTFWLVDHGEADLVLAATGLLRIAAIDALGMAMDLEIVLSATMAQRVDVASAGNHLVSNFSGRRRTPRSTGVSPPDYYVAHRTDSPDPLVAQAISDWHDVFVPDGDGGWLISSRRLEIALQPDGPPA